MMARQSAAQSGKRGFQASLRSTFRRGRQARQITTMRAIRQEGPPPDLGGEEPKKLPLRLGMRRGSLMTADRFLVLHHRRRCGGDRHGGGLFRTTLRRALGLLRGLLGRLLLGRLLGTLRGGLLRRLPGGLLGSLLRRTLLRRLLGGLLLGDLLLRYLFLGNLLLGGLLGSLLRQIGRAHV